MKLSTNIKYISNISWLFWGRVLRYGIGIFVSVIVPRYLKPEQFGILNYCVAFVSFLSGLAILGLPQLLIRDFTKIPNSVGLRLGTTIILTAVSSGLTYLILLMVLSFFRPKETLIFNLCAIIGLSLFFNVKRLLVSYFEYRVKSKYIVISETCSYLIAAVCKIIAIYMLFDILSIGAIIVFEFLLGTIFLCGFYQKYGKKIKWTFDKGMASKILKDSYPLIFSTAVIALHLRVDQIMVKELSSSYKAGI